MTAKQFAQLKNKILAVQGEFLEELYAPPDLTL